jgi:hypothetical protein
VLLSPFVRAGSTSSVPYNHYSLLRSLEDIFQLHEHIGYAENDSKIDYHLETIGDDQSVFKSQQECGYGSGGRW